MTEPASHPDKGTYHGTTEAARDFVAEMAAGLIAHANVVLIYADQGYDAGLCLAARNTAAYLRALNAGLAELERSRAVARYRAAGATAGPSEDV